MYTHQTLNGLPVRDPDMPLIYILWALEEKTG